MKAINDMKLGEAIEEDMLFGAIPKGSRLLKITYTLQDKVGLSMDVSLKHKDYYEDKEEEEGEDDN